jgi:hypothetical protein
MKLLIADPMSLSYLLGFFPQAPADARRIVEECTGPSSTAALARRATSALLRACETARCILGRIASKSFLS